MAELGVLGLIAGVWVALTHRASVRGQPDRLLAALGWILVVLSALLILSGNFPGDLTSLVEPPCQGAVPCSDS
jgi:uncharacterized membrane protein